MIRWIYLSIILVSSITQLSAQEESESKYFIGGYYTIKIGTYIIESSLDTAKVTEQFLNVNFRYAFNHKWRIGAEYILMHTAKGGIDDPFSTFGLTVDYDFLRVKRSKLNLRAGISFSNLSYADVWEPQKRFVFNRIIGLSYEFRITKVIWLNTGFYGHHPLNKIEFKYDMVQPFIGICAGI